MIELDSLSPVPAYEQILLQIRAAIASGDLSAGKPLPPIRQLASDLEINPATVAKAYQHLEKDGLIRTAGRKGTFVHAQAPSQLKDVLRQEASREMRDWLAQWQERGLGLRELKQLFERLSHNPKTKESL